METSMMAAHAKDGRVITFKWADHTKPQADSEETHRLTACVDGEAVGYLRLAFVSPASYNRKYPSILEFLARDHFWLREAQTLDERLNALSLLLDSHYDRLDKARLATMSEDQKHNLCTSYRQKANHRFGKGFALDRWRHAGKPYVRFILVEGPYLHQGIATAMYLRTAQMLWDTYGCRLYSGSSRSESAEPVWQKLKSMVPVGEERHPISGGVRYFIDLGASQA